MGRYIAFLKKHWEWATAILVTLVGIVIYYVRSRSGSGSASSPVSQVSTAVPAVGGTSGGNGASAPDMTPIVAELQAEQQQSQSWWQQAMQAMSDAFTANNQQQQSRAQQTQSSLASILAQDQAALAQQLSQAQSVGVATGGIGPVAAPTAGNVAAWAQSLDIPLSWAQGYLADGHTMGEGIPSLNGWLDSKGYRNSNGSLNLVPASVKAAGSQAGAYVSGDHPATAASPAGGGEWNGQTDQQIRDLFARTYGSQAAGDAAWNQQHAAAVAKNGA